jgi:TonB family protein
MAYLNGRHWHASIILAGCCLGAGSAVASGGQESAEVAAARARIAALEKKQHQLLDSMKQRATLTDDASAREEMLRTVREIESRPRPRYFSPGAPATDKMLAYYARMTKKLEECSYRNYPKRDGRGVYGQGAISVTLDSAGNALQTVIDKSSGDHLLDAQVVRIVRASSPFGPVPAKIFKSDIGRYDRLIISTGFDFMRDNSPAIALKPSERCRNLEAG